jgi:hypothetical protein
LRHDRPDQPWLRGVLRLEEAYYHSRVFSPEQYTAFIRLLEIFGQQLSAVANRLIFQDAEAEPPMIRRAKAYIAGHAGVRSE